MKVLINDANILIDLVKLGIEEAFLSLHFDLYTTDFVFAELTDEQQKRITSESLKVIVTDTPEDFSGIVALQSGHKGVSFEDCSVWYYARRMAATMITGDATLRKKVEQSGLEVKGIIFIIEEIKNQGKLSVADCIALFEELKLLNKRLPFVEIDKRIQKWKNEQ